jgi:hypothetical protein
MFKNIWRTTPLLGGFVMKELLRNMVNELIRIDKIAHGIHSVLEDDMISSYGLLENIGDGFRSVIRKTVVIDPDDLDAEYALNADIVSLTQPYSYSNFPSDVKTFDQFLEKWKPYIKHINL